MFLLLLMAVKWEPVVANLKPVIAAAAEAAGATEALANKFLVITLESICVVLYCVMLCKV